MEKEGAQLRGGEASSSPERVAASSTATGNPDHGIWSAGLVQGLIHDIPTCKELVHRIVREAEAIIAERLEGFMRRPPASGRIGGLTASAKKEKSHESLCVRRQRR